MLNVWNNYAGCIFRTEFSVPCWYDALNIGISLDGKIMGKVDNFFGNKESDYYFALVCPSLGEENKDINFSK